MFKLHPLAPIRLSKTRSLTATMWLALALGMLPAHSQESGEAKARRLLKESRFVEALGAIDNELRERPQDGPLWLLKGAALSMNDRKDDAIQIFRKMIQDRMEVASAYNNLGVIYTERGDYDSAKVALEHAIRSRPEYTVALRNLGNVYANLAGMSYKRALQLDESDHTLSTRLTHLGDLLGKRFDQVLGPQFASSSAPPAHEAVIPAAPRFDRSATRVVSLPSVSQQSEPVFIPSKVQPVVQAEAPSRSQEAVTLEEPAPAAPAPSKPLILPRSTSTASIQLASAALPTPQPLVIQSQPSVAKLPPVAQPNSQTTATYAARNAPTEPVTLEPVAAVARQVVTQVAINSKVTPAVQAQISRQPIQAVVATAGSLPTAEAKTAIIKTKTPVTFQWQKNPVALPPVRISAYKNAPVVLPAAATVVSAAATSTVAAAALYCDGVAVAGAKCLR